MLTESNLDNKAHYSKPAERLQDALSSLNYLLLTAVPADMTKHRVEALAKFLRIVNITLPDSQQVSNIVYWVNMDYFCFGSIFSVMVCLSVHAVF